MNTYINKLFDNKNITEILKLIEETDVSNIKFKRDNNILHLACEYGILELIEPLLNIGIDINSTNEKKETPLFNAIWNSHFNTNLEVINFLLENGSNISSKDIYGNLPLHIACLNDNVHVIHLLLSNKEHINAPNNDGDTPLHFTCENNLINTTQYLLNNNVDLTAKNKNGNTPLDLAIELKHNDIIKVINSFQEYTKLNQDILSFSVSKNIKKQKL